MRVRTAHEVATALMGVPGQYGATLEVLEGWKAELTGQPAVRRDGEICGMMTPPGRPLADLLAEEARSVEGVRQVGDPDPIQAGLPCNFGGKIGCYCSRCQAKEAALGPLPHHQV